jgi:hypothetical protein
VGTESVDLRWDSKHGLRRECKTSGREPAAARHAPSEAQPSPPPHGSGAADERRTDCADWIPGGSGRVRAGGVRSSPTPTSFSDSLERLGRHQTSREELHLICRPPRFLWYGRTSGHAAGDERWALTRGKMRTPTRTLFRPRRAGQRLSCLYGGSGPPRNPPGNGAPARAMRCAGRRRRAAALETAAECRDAPRGCILPLALRCAARNCPINSRLRRRGGLRTRRQCLVLCGCRSRGARAPPVLACAASGTTATPAKARGSPVCRRHFSSADPTFGRDRLHVEQVVFCRDRCIAVHVTFREWPTAEGVEGRDARPRKGNASRARCLVIAAVFRWTCFPRSDRLVLRRISSQFAGTGKWEILREN